MLTREKLRNFHMWAKNFVAEQLKKKNRVKDRNCWFYYLKMFHKFQILKKALKRAKNLKNLKNRGKKLHFFCSDDFTREGKKSKKNSCFMLNFLGSIIVRKKCRPWIYYFWTFFQAIWPNILVENFDFWNALFFKN